MKQSFEQIQEKYRPTVEKRLAEFLVRAAADGISWNAEMSRYHFSTGGKRLRALIPCLVFDAYGKSPLEAIDLGCALEMIHNATLVHDDLQDGDTTRRGKPTVWKKHSQAQAINCGNAMFQFAFQILCELKLDPAVFRQIATRVTRGTLQVIEGQAQEFLMKDEEYPRLDRYLGVVRGKTAALMATSVVSALDALGQSRELCDPAEKAALDSGVLFQIQDDILDIYGAKERDQSATDIAEGKISVLVALFNDAANPQERARVAEVLKTPRERTTPEQIAEVLRLFEKYEIRKAALQRIHIIQNSLQSDPVLSQHPEIHGLLVSMNQTFLKPIGHLLT
jgi:geranylgeranyl diphosphate synthase type I